MVMLFYISTNPINRFVSHAYTNVQTNDGMRRTPTYS